MLMLWHQSMTENYKTYYFTNIDKKYGEAKVSNIFKL